MNETNRKFKLVVSKNSTKSDKEKGLLEDSVKDVANLILQRPSIVIKEN